MKKWKIVFGLLLVSALVLIGGCTQVYDNAGGTSTSGSNISSGGQQGNGVTSNGSPAGGTGTPDASSGSQQEAFVKIKDFAFSPATITVPAGTKVTWTNEDNAPHIVASGPHPTHTGLPGFESSSLSAGQSYSFTFTEKGTFGYHCHLHPSMEGTVIVE